MTSGIRQGCPLSPLVFAVVMDVLLRRFDSHLPGHHTHKAFADDVGLVLENIAVQLPVLVTILEEYGRISGMKVNIEKTVGLPLWPDFEQEAQEIIDKVAQS
jgi:hypothetical protein